MGAQWKARHKEIAANAKGKIVQGNHGRRARWGRPGLELAFAPRGRASQESLDAA